MVILAKQVNVNVDYKDMEKSLQNGEFRETVIKDLDFSRNLGIRQTPTLVVNGIAIQTGSMSCNQIKDATENAIESEVK
nr:thioredoxin domain-containing protein [Paenibacillus sp. OSY-SE]